MIFFSFLKEPGRFITYCDILKWKIAIGENITQAYWGDRPLSTVTPHVVKHLACSAWEEMSSQQIQT